MTDTPQQPARPHRPPKRNKQRHVIDLDADEHNANWLRILEQERQKQNDKEQQPHDDAARG